MRLARICAVLRRSRNPLCFHRAFRFWTVFSDWRSVCDARSLRKKVCSADCSPTVIHAQRELQKPLADGGATRAGSRTTPRASTLDAAGISDESRRRSRFDKPRASRDRLVSAGPTARQLHPVPTRSYASHDGEPCALGGPRGGRRPPGRRAPRDRRPRLLGRALAPRRCAHDRARRRRQDGASFPRYRARSGANARRLTLRLRKPSTRVHVKDGG